MAVLFITASLHFERHIQRTYLENLSPKGIRGLWRLREQNNNLPKSKSERFGEGKELPLPTSDLHKLILANMFRNWLTYK